MASIVSELLEVLSKYPYEPCLRLINKNTKCDKYDVDELRKTYAKNYMIDATICVSKSGKIKPNGIFEIFGLSSKKSPSNTCKAMIKWAKDETLNLARFCSTAFLQLGDLFVDWLHNMKSDYTPGIELALYCLSKMYIRHVHVHTKKLYWTTVQHTWGDSERGIMVKCEFSLVYMGPGKFGKFVPLVTNNNEQTVQIGKNTPSTNNANQVKIDNEDSTSEIITENVSTCSKGENAMENVLNTTPETNTKYTSIPRRSSTPQGAMRCKPRPNLVEMVRAAELLKPSRSLRSRKTNKLCGHEQWH